MKACAGWLSILPRPQTRHNLGTFYVAPYFPQEICCESLTMNSELRPLRVQPQFVPRIWGTRSLAPLFPDAHPAEPIGEVWLTGNDCVVVDAPFAGKTVADAWRTMPLEWKGTRLSKDGPFPLLIKFLFPEQKLSVQVHPNDAYARAHEAKRGGIGKTEMWYAITAQANAHVYSGLNGDVTAEKLRQRIEDGGVEGCLNRIDLAAGDAVFVPAGTLHTIGAGMLLCEVQENSDITYRVFDYGRKNSDGTERELQVEKALAVTNFGPQRGGKISPIRTAHGCCEVMHYVACPYFAVERYRFVAPLAISLAPGAVEVCIILEGRGRIVWDTGAEDYAASEARLIPAGLKAMKFEPSSHTTLLRAFVPDLEAYKNTLIESGVPAAAVSQIVHA
jgi:mannose-6-phosphate isomerase